MKLRIQNEPFQQQNAVAENVRFIQHLTKTLRHGAEVLSNDHAACPCAFKCHLTQQLQERIGDIGAIRAAASST